MLALACDHVGFELLNDIKRYLDEVSIKFKDFGTYSTERCDYPEYAIPASRAVADGTCTHGILICGSGIGMSIAANKVTGIRAALCRDIYSAEMTRKHNDANILVMGARLTVLDHPLKIVETFLNTDFEGGRHSNRLQMIADLEAGLR